CSFCSQDIAKLDVLDRQAHYDRHLDDPPDYNSGEDMPSSIPFKSSSQPSHRSSDHDVFWHPSLSTPPPHNCTPGLIPLLRRALVSQHERRHIQRAVLCTNRAVHVYRENFDHRWGCGYRNYMMACAVLMDQRFQDTYAALFERHEPPGVRNLQSLIEQAWKAGFDEEGAEQLRRRLCDTTKWIGTAELFVAFTYLGVPSRLVDFALPRRIGSYTRGPFTQSSSCSVLNSLRPLVIDTRPLLDWVREYFSPSDQHKHSSVHDAWKNASAVTQTERPPLILQHNGHSRTIVGYEIDRKGQMVLLAFDPSRHAPSSSVNAQRRARRRLTAAKPRSSSSISSNPSTRTAPNSMSGATPEVIEVDSDGEVVERATRGRAPMDDVRTLKGKGRNGTALPPSEIIKSFRLDPRTLGSQEKYQILWFPLDDPLTEQEKDARRVVTSSKIC
ncbi:peptidase family C78-domain-containing protein, partial [Vararia minispora EC-137]